MPAAIVNLPKLPLFNKGLVSQRNPLVVPISQFATNIVQHHDALYDGANIELSSNNTLVRRWGLSRYSAGTLPTSSYPDLFYLFRNTTGTLRTMTATLGATESVYQYDSISTTAVPITDTALSSSHWAMQSFGDYLYVMKGLDQAYRWQPDHVVGGLSTFRMGIAAPKEPPTIVATRLPFNEVTSTVYDDTTLLNGKIIIQEASLSISDYTIQINADNTVDISWTYSAYPASSTAPSTDTTQLTPAGHASKVYVDPPSGSAFVSITGIAVASRKTSDIATALINNTQLVTTDYGIPVVTFTSVAGVTSTATLGAAITLVVAPDATVASDIFANTAVVFTPGTKNINSIIQFPFVDKNTVLTGSFDIKTYVDGVLSTTQTYSGTDYDAIAGNVNAGGFHLAYVEKDGDLWQLTIAGVFPSPALPATNTMALLGSNSLNGGSLLSPTTSFVNSYAVHPLTGIKFGYVWRNPTTGHISTMSPSVTLEPSDAPVFVSIQTPLSLDPQATVPELYATADGGSTFALAPQFATGKTFGLWTFGYITPDQYLNEQVVAPLDFANEPPPKRANGLVQHTQRMWAFVDNILYYSGGPDTANGLGSEAWPPANNFTFPGPIIKLMSTPYGLLVFLKDDVHIVEGTDKASYFSHIFAANFGISNPNAAVLDAQTVYAYTTARQLQAFGPGVQKEIGYDIAQDLQNAVDPSRASVVMLRGRSTDNALFISNGVDRMYRWTPTTGSQWSPVGIYSTSSIGTIAAMEVGVGDIRLIAGASGFTSAFTLPIPSYVMQRDPSTYTDLGTPFSAFAVIGSIPLTDPGISVITGVDNVVLQTTPAGTFPLVSAVLNELDGRNQSLFIQLGINNPIPDPPTVRLPSTSLRQLRYYAKNSIVPFNERGQNLFIRLDWGAENARNEVLGLYVSDKVQ